MSELELKLKGKKLAGMRRAKGLLQKQLADKLGITRQTVSAIERGQNDAASSTVEKWVEICNGNIEELQIPVESHSKNRDLHEKLDLIMGAGGTPRDWIEQAFSLTWQRFLAENSGLVKPEEKKTDRPPKAAAS